jgi:hypothetical protein
MKLVILEEKPYAGLWPYDHKGNAVLKERRQSIQHVCETAAGGFHAGRIQLFRSVND